MARLTLEFYIAMLLLIVAVTIALILLHFLDKSKRNKFDPKKEKTVVSKLKGGTIGVPRKVQNVPIKQPQRRMFPIGKK